MGILQTLGSAFAPEPVVVIEPPKWQKRMRRWALRKAWKVAKRAVRRVWRWTRALVPWYVATWAWLTAAVAGLFDDGWKTLAALSVAGMVPVWWWCGGWAGKATRRRKLKPVEQRCWYAGFYALLAVWVPVGAVWTVWPPWSGVLWIGTFAVWVRWLWLHRTRKTKTVVSHHDATWAKVKPLNGTKLTNVVELESPKRWEALVELSDTNLLVKDVTAAVPHIAKRFRVPIGNVIADYAPARLEDVASLTVVQDNPCNGAIVYDESWIPSEKDIAEGCVPFHLYPNGMRARVRLWLPGAGTVNSLFSGDIRTGKSAGMDAKMTQQAFTGKVWPMAADPQGGVSMPVWCKADGTGLAKWQATDMDAIYRQLQAWEAAVFARSEAMSEFRWVDKWGDEQVGINCWDPTIPGMPPAVAWSCDEFWMLMLHDDFYEIFKRCLKIQNKVGMLMDIATQYPGIEEFHNDMALRQPLTAGNLLAYRNTATSVRSMILPSHLPSPMEIPTETPTGEHTKGTLIAASQAPRSSVPVYSRSVWVERGRYWASKAVERVPELDAVTAAAFAKFQGKPQTIEEQPAREKVTVTAKQPAPKKERALDRMLAYLATRDDRQAHTGVIAEALNMPVGTVSTTMRRAEGTAVVQPRTGIWALPAVDRENELVA